MEVGTGNDLRATPGYLKTQIVLRGSAEENLKENLMSEVTGAIA